MKCQPGSLVTYVTKEPPFHPRIQHGCLGIVLTLADDWANFLPGMSPVNVLFGDEVTRVFEDELEVLYEER